MRLKFYTLDVFTSVPFGGNPLAVVLGADNLTTEQMQAITREFNLSETTFVMKPDAADNSAKVRIFFPGGEMPFAGHPTLGTAALLADLSVTDDEPFRAQIRLEMKAGLTPVSITRNEQGLFGSLTAPVNPFAADVKTPANDAIAKCLNLKASDIGFDAHTPAVVEAGPRFLMVPLKSREALQNAKIIEPNWSKLLEKMPGVDGAYLYTKGGDNSKTSFRARMYAPTGGIPEDPATGSATVMLAHQILTHDKPADGTHHFQLEQGYEMGRPSDLVLSFGVKAGALEAVLVSGSVVRMMEGEMKI
jgi:trans-2,3-dihydro-3-hydroxyanthranilate isomerase